MLLIGRVQLDATRSANSRAVYRLGYLPNGANHLTDVEKGALLRLIVTSDVASCARISLPGRILWDTTLPKRVTMDAV